MNEAQRRGRAVRGLREMIVPGYATDEQRAARAELWGGHCYMCGAPAIQMDHVKPIAAGGANWPCNLRPICVRCNSKKGSIWPWGRVEMTVWHSGRAVRMGYAWGPSGAGKWYPEQFIWEALP